MENKNKIIKNSFYLMVIILIGKIIGFLKQSVIAWKFGTTASLDIYFSADSFVNMISQILIMSIPPAIVTILIKNQKKEHEKEMFISSVFTFFLITGSIIILLNILVSPLMSKVLGISYTSEQQLILNKYLIYLSPTIIFACISGVSSGLLQSKSKFWQDKLMGIFLSVSIIISTILLESKLKVVSLLIGFDFGYFIFSVMMLILLLKNVRIRITNPFKNQLFLKYIKLLIPIVIGISIVDISHLVDKIIASSLSSGSVSSLYYSQIICSDLVNSVIIASIGIVLLPKVSMEIENKTNEEIASDIGYIFSITIPVMLFITFLYLVIGKEFISIVFERGAFTLDSTMIVYKCSVCYALGLPFLMVKEVLSKYLYAMDDTFSPMVSNVIAILINIALSIFLSHKIGVSGIALATSISIIISNIILLLGIKKHIKIFNIINHSLNDLLKGIAILIPTCIFGVIVKIFIKQTLIVILAVTICSIILFILFSKLLNINLYKEMNNIKKRIINKLRSE